MKTAPRIGAVGEQKFVVDTPHVIHFAREGMPPVLSTPSLAWFLEHAAIAVLTPCLEPGECSVGSEIELQHLAPTPPGCTVICRARVIQVEGAAIAFQLEAEDDLEKIARGFHKRWIVQVSRFNARIGKKLRPPKPATG